jgi:GntR family transcriptional repressor for pyruvate dehydrogenase complex
LDRFQPIKKVTITEQIMENIAQMITDGKLVPGEQLPNERLLAEQFGVARGRIREALRALSLVGLITIKAGEGSFIGNREQPIRKDTITWLFHHELHNLDEVYDARKLIESCVYLSAAKYATDEQFIKLDEILSKMKMYANKNKPNAETFAMVLNELDLYIGEICGNQIYFKLMQTMIHLRQNTIERLLNVPGSIKKSIETRSLLIDALKSRDINKVEKAIDYFFESARTFYLNIIDKK